MDETRTDPLAARIGAALEASPARVIRLEHGDRTVWIKRKERLSAVRRLQKGDPARAFEAERRAYHMSHGRPSPKDICWDGARVTFLDFERYDSKRNTPRGHAIDLILFVFSGLSIAQGPCPEMDAAIAAYRARDPGGIWDRARRICTRLGWVGWLTRPVLRRRAGKSSEIKAIPMETFQRA